MGEASRNKPLMVFDWDKAAQIIRERNASVASAGLSQDWEWTGGQIYADGNPDTDSYTYLASTWATPELDVDGDVIDCWRFAADTPDWDASTKWPDSALRILRATHPQQPAQEGRVG